VTKALTRLVTAEHDEGYINPNRDMTWQERMDNKYKGKPRPADELPEGTFKGNSPGGIANTLKTKSEDYGQASRRLNNYINRQGRNLEGQERQRLNQTKEALRNAYGEKKPKPAQKVQKVQKTPKSAGILFENENAMTGYDEAAINPIHGDPDSPDCPLTGVHGSAEMPVQNVVPVHNFDDGYLKTGLDEEFVEQPREEVNDMTVPLNAATRLAATEVNADKWSKDVETKKHPPEGKFADGSAEEIANWAKRSHNGNLKKAIDSLNFYVNRGGKNLSDEQKSKVNHAKEILHKQVEKE
jgi:hypothetical protein